MFRTRDELSDSGPFREHNIPFLVVNRILPETSLNYIGADHLLILGRDRDRAVRMVERSVEIDPDDSVVAYNAACFYALAGEADKALDWLERAAAMQHGFALKDWMASDPDIDILRSLPRFQEIVGRIR